MNSSTYFKPIMVLCLLPMLLLNASVTQAASSTCGGWSVVKSPSPSTNDIELPSVATVSKNDVWAVGYYYMSSAVPQILTIQTLIEHWNGKQWSIVKSPSPGSMWNSLSSVAAVTATDIWAVGLYVNSNNIGQTLIEHWNGKQWQVVPSPSPGSVSSGFAGVAVVTASDVWAVGGYSNKRGVGQTLTEHWNGQQWSIVKSPNVGTNPNILNGVAVISASDVWAVGTYGPGHTLKTLTEHWNGQQWNTVKSPSPGSVDNRLYGVAAVTANDVWAVGFYYNGSGSQPTLTEHWNGQQWSTVSSPSPGSGGALNGVAAVTTTNIWAVGVYAKGHTEQTLIEQWNGMKWQVVPSPSPGKLFNYLTGVAAVSTSDVWAVGRAVDRTLIEFYC